MGLFVVYILPVVTYLQKLKIESDNPLFAEAAQISNMYYNVKMYQEKLPKEMVPMNSSQRLHEEMGLEEVESNSSISSESFAVKLIGYVK